MLLHLTLPRMDANERELWKAELRVNLLNPLSTRLSMHVEFLKLQIRQFYRSASKRWMVRLKGSRHRRLFACIRGHESPVSPVVFLVSGLASRNQNSAGMMSLGSSG